MELTRYPTIVLYGQIHVSRKRGCPKKRWINSLEDDYDEMGLKIVEAKTLAATGRDKRR